MVMTISQSQVLINQFNNLSINQKVQVADPVMIYVLCPFEGNINTVDPQGIKFYLQEKK